MYIAMRAVAKVLSLWEEIIGGLLPEMVRLIVLAVVISWKQWKHVVSSYRYTSTMNKKSSSFTFHCSTSTSTNDERRCSICQSELAEGDEAKELLDCCHVFHRPCLDTWLRAYRPTCPLCRSVVVPELIVNEYNQARLDPLNDAVQKELALILLKVLHAGTSRHSIF